MIDPVQHRRRHWLGAAMALTLLPIGRARGQAAGFVPQALPVERIAAERLAEDGTAPPLHKPIHSTGELLPVIGLPAGICTAPDDRATALAPESIGHFMQAGGRVIHLAADCDEVLTALGRSLMRSAGHEKLFTAIRIGGADATTVHARVEVVRQRLRIPRIDLVCLPGPGDTGGSGDIGDAAERLAALHALKTEGRIRHVGIASAPHRSAGLEQILKRGTPDFIETGYALERRDADQWLLPFALEHEISVLVTSPFGDGLLHQTVQRQPLPKWSADFGCTSWNQFLLKYVASHPAVTCVIPDGEPAASLFSAPPAMTGPPAVGTDAHGGRRADTAAADGIAPVSLLADYAAAARNPMPDTIERKRMERFADALRQ